MIVSLVSKYRQVGKNHACNAIIKSKVAGKVQVVEFTKGLKLCAGIFMPGYYGKHDIVPQFGVSRIDVVNAISEALENLHPELPVMKVKNEIEELVFKGWHVLIPDVRRKREFEWLDSLAERHGVEHHIVEIVPMETYRVMRDTWQSATGEPCGYEVWWGRHRSIIPNDGTRDFDRRVVSLFRGLIYSLKKKC